MECSLREGCSPPAPMLTVTSNHWPRLTESGATIFGVCFGSKEVRNCLYSGVNCSSCPPHTGCVAAPMIDTPRATPTAHLTHGVESLRIFLHLLHCIFAATLAPLRNRRLCPAPAEHVVGHDPFLFTRHSQQPELANLYRVLHSLVSAPGHQNLSGSGVRFKSLGHIHFVADHRVIRPPFGPNVSSNHNARVNSVPHV